jgi:phage-related protein
MQAVFYRDPKGGEPVRDFLDDLDGPVRASIAWQITRLNELQPTDPPLAFPHSSQVEGELRELRCHHGRRLFLLYWRSEQLFVLLHIFEKTTGRVLPAEIAVAHRRWDDFKARMDARPRTPPRPLGQDAP